MRSDRAAPIEQWTAKRRVVLVVRTLKGATSVAEAARRHGFTVGEIEDWREKFLLGSENSLRSRPKDEDAVRDEQIKILKQKIGDLVLDNDILREALKPCHLDRETAGCESRCVGCLGTPRLLGIRGAPDARVSSRGTCSTPLWSGSSLD
jgi:transposase-like protein